MNIADHIRPGPFVSVDADHLEKLRNGYEEAVELRAKVAELEAQLAAGGEAVGEVVLESMGIGDAQIVRFHMYKEIPPVGTKLYTNPQPAAPAGVPEGYAVVPIEPTPQMLDALRTGSRKDWPSDELCRVRYVSLLTAAPNAQEKGEG